MLLINILNKKTLSSLLLTISIISINLAQKPPILRSIENRHETDSVLYQSQVQNLDLQEQLKAQYELNITKQDTSLIIANLIDLADMDRWRGDYETSFDKLWSALLLTKEGKRQKLEVRILRNLGILYEIYHQDSLALGHLNQSLTLAKKLVNQGKLPITAIVQGYFSISTVYRNNHYYTKAMTYLDSCELMYDHNRRLPFVQADKGLLNFLIGNYDLAETELHDSYQYFVKRNDRYQIMMLYYLGDLKRKTNDPDSAIYYYEKSLSILNSNPAHVEIKPELYKKLSELYLTKKQYPIAYQYLKASKEVSDILFSTIHDRNKQLFGIKNKYLETIQEKEALIESKNQEIEKKNRIVFQLYIAVGVIVLIGVFVFILLRFRAKIKQVQLKQELKNEQTQTVLDLKNKELTTYALKMMEKERAVMELLDAIKNNTKVNHASLYNKHVTNSDNLWENFNLRFMELNNGFYESLKSKHSDLTPTEQKHCALIKLDFSNHEMAQLLNISLQSVHTSRYRIRKKLNLEKDESLSNYIYTL